MLANISEINANINANYFHAFEIDHEITAKLMGFYESVKNNPPDGMLIIEEITSKERANELFQNRLPRVRTDFLNQVLHLSNSSGYGLWSEWSSAEVMWQFQNSSFHHEFVDYIMSAFQMQSNLWMVTGTYTIENGKSNAGFRTIPYSYSELKAMYNQ